MYEIFGNFVFILTCDVNTPSLSQFILHPECVKELSKKPDWELRLLCTIFADKCEDEWMRKKCSYVRHHVWSDTISFRYSYPLVHIMSNMCLPQPIVTSELRTEPWVGHCLQLSYTLTQERTLESIKRSTMIIESSSTDRLYRQLMNEVVCVSPFILTPTKTDDQYPEWLQTKRYRYKYSLCPKS